MIPLTIKLKEFTEKYIKNAYRRKMLQFSNPKLWGCVVPIQILAWQKLLCAGYMSTPPHNFSPKGLRGKKFWRTMNMCPVVFQSLLFFSFFLLSFLKRSSVARFSTFSISQWLYYSRNLFAFCVFEFCFVLGEFFCSFLTTNWL